MYSDQQYLTYLCPAIQKLLSRHLACILTCRYHLKRSRWQQRLFDTNGVEIILNKYHDLFSFQLPPLIYHIRNINNQRELFSS